MADPKDLGGYDDLFPGNRVPPGPAPPFLSVLGGGQTDNNLARLVQSFIPLVGELVRNQTNSFASTFNGERGVYDAYMARESLYAVQRARTAGAQQDVGRLRDIMTGMFSMSGAEITPEVRSAVGRMADRGGQILPYLAAFAPDAVDQAMGSIGSRTVAADRFAMSARYMTGGDQQADINRFLAGDIRSAIPEADRVASAVTRSAQSGTGQGGVPVSTITEVVRSVAREFSLNDSQRDSLLNATRRASGGSEDLTTLQGRGRAGRTDIDAFSKTVIDKLYGTGEPDNPFTTQRTAGLGVGRVADMFEQLSRKGLVSVSGDTKTAAEAAAKQLEEYAKAFAVVKDIFGDMNQDAPTSKILASLESIGQLGGASAARTTQLVSQFRAASAITPIDYAGQARYSEIGAQFGAQYGLRKALNADPATWVGARAAYADRYSGVQGPELPNQDEYITERIRLRAQGQASEFANVTGAAISLAKYTPKDSPLSQLVQAMGEGKTSANIGGRTFDVTKMQMNDYERLAQQSGLDYGAFQSALLNRSGNQSARIQFANRNSAFNNVDPQAQLAELSTSLRGFLGAYGINNAGRVAETFLKYSGQRTYKDSAGNDVEIQDSGDAARATAQELRLPAAQAARIEGAVRQYGLSSTNGRDDAFMFNRARLVNQAAQASEAGARAQLEQRAQLIQQLTPISRGTIAAKAADYAALLGGANREGTLGALGALGGGAITTNAARPDLDWLKFGLSIFGYTSNESISKATNGVLPPAANTPEATQAATAALAGGAFGYGVPAAVLDTKRVPPPAGPGATPDVTRPLPPQPPGPVAPPGNPNAQANPANTGPSRVQITNNDLKVTITDVKGGLRAFGTALFS